MADVGGNSGGNPHSSFEGAPPGDPEDDNATSEVDLAVEIKQPEIEEENRKWLDWFNDEWLEKRVGEIDEDGNEDEHKRSLLSQIPKHVFDRIKGDLEKRFKDNKLTSKEEAYLNRLRKDIDDNYNLSITLKNALGDLKLTVKEIFRGGGFSFNENELIKQFMDTNAPEANGDYDLGKMPRPLLEAIKRRVEHALGYGNVLTTEELVELDQSVAKLIEEEQNKDPNYSFKPSSAVEIAASILTRRGYEDSELSLEKRTNYIDQLEHKKTPLWKIPEKIIDRIGDQIVEAFETTDPLDENQQRFVQEYINGTRSFTDYDDMLTQDQEIYNQIENRIEGRIEFMVARYNRDTLTLEEQWWIDWLEEDDDRMVKDIPENIRIIPRVIKEIDAVLTRRQERNLGPTGDDFYEAFEVKCTDAVKTFDRSFLNSDIVDFINGEEVVLVNSILELRNGKTTNVLSLAMFKNGEYAASGRYVLRALLRTLLKSGSKGEKRDVLFFVKNLINEVGYKAYPGADDTLLGADVQHILSNAGRENDVFASGADKPLGYQGRGTVRQLAIDNVNQCCDAVKGMLLGGDSKILDTDGIDQDNPAKEYDELRSSGKGRIDPMIEMTRTLADGKLSDTIDFFPGKDQFIVADFFRTLQLARQHNDTAAERLFRISSTDGRRNWTNLEAQAKVLYHTYKTNVTYSGRLTPSLENALLSFIRAGDPNYDIPTPNAAPPLPTQ
ncbi:hypothetical protein FWH58_00865 [Candidatus Saccharibacteria bacterium]|nr:hypothetical protein [Candidatus Saccharibacteria bacterium]